MKTQMIRSGILAVMLVSGAAGSCFATGMRDYFELKIYRYETDSQEKRLDHFLESAYIPALHRAGIDHVGVFKPRDKGAIPEKYLMVLVPFSSLEACAKLTEKLRKDEKYQEAGRDYIHAPHDDPPYLRIETVLLRAFSTTPHLSIPELESPRSGRVYELRSYQGATEMLYERKVEMFNTGEAALFEKLGFNPVFFGEAISSSEMPHLMYMTTFSDTVSQKEHWNAFRIHPEWEEMKTIERYKNTVSHITKYLLYPTPYSDY